MINHKQELWEDLDELRDYALTLKRTSQDILDWIHVIETDMQLFIDDQTKPAFVKLDTPTEPELKPKPKPTVNPLVFPFEPGSACIDPDGVGCRCYEGCTADCLPSEYKACKCPRKISNVLEHEPEPEPDEPVYTLTEKGELIMRLIDQGHKYLDACRIAEQVFPMKE